MFYKFVLSPGLSKAIQNARSYKYQFGRVDGHKKFYFYTDRMQRQRADFRLPPRGLNRQNYQMPTDVYLVSHQTDTVDSRNYDFDLAPGLFKLEYEGFNVFRVLDNPPDDEQTPWVKFIAEPNN